ncbi:hypothetical protein GN156_20285 [bacterium LRH843]|uniref:uncharacterized protein LOC111060760 isoform X1 n=1 Tax=Nilaparvata lugens TaxID=108931 RepID=UPI0013CC83F6|nr:uncharacterized protein LOC111060760 isoform X1 [Nilaparvata lugens]NEU33036.1 hypothetical protein [bacterium LRH843]
MASFKVMLFVVLVAVAAVVCAEERVKKAAIYPYAAAAYAYGSPYAYGAPIAALPYGQAYAAPYAAYPYAKAFYAAHDDGSYFPGKYDPYY